MFVYSFFKKRKLHNNNFQITEAKPTLKFNPEEDFPITLDLCWRPPRFLVARLLTGACKPGENSLISMQKALMNYWQEVHTFSSTKTFSGSDDITYDPHLFFI